MMTLYDPRPSPDEQFPAALMLAALAVVVVWRIHRLPVRNPAWRRVWFRWFLTGALLLAAAWFTSRTSAGDINQLLVMTHYTFYFSIDEWIADLGRMLLILPVGFVLFLWLGTLCSGMLMRRGH